jgi:hypothetical protein
MGEDFRCMVRRARGLQTWFPCTCARADFLPVRPVFTLPSYSPFHREEAPRCTRAGAKYQPWLRYRRTRDPVRSRVHPDRVCVEGLSRPSQSELRASPAQPWDPPSPARARRRPASPSPRGPAPVGRKWVNGDEMRAVEIVLQTLPRLRAARIHFANKANETKY